MPSTETPVRKLSPALADSRAREAGLTPPAVSLRPVSHYWLRKYVYYQ